MQKQLQAPREQNSPPSCPGVIILLALIGAGYWGAATIRDLNSHMP
jgi:hypothetical protein